MMIPHFLDSVRRLWYVALAGALLTFVWCAFIWQTSPVYSTRSEVLFVDAGVSDAASYIVQPNTDLIRFVAVVEQVVNSGKPVVRLMSSAATISGLGVREGASAYLLNEGTQWVPIFSRPVLVVEAVAETREAALAAHHSEVARIGAVADQLQEEQGIPAPSRAHPVPILADPTVVRMGSSRVGQVMAVGAAGAAGAALTAGAIVLLDRRRRIHDGPAPDSTARMAALEPAGPVDMLSD